jgi:hypothetical protein
MGLGPIANSLFYETSQIVTDPYNAYKWVVTKCQLFPSLSSAFLTFSR